MSITTDQGKAVFNLSTLCLGCVILILPPITISLLV